MLRAVVLGLALASPVTEADVEAIQAAIHRQTLEKSASCAVYRPAAVRFRDLLQFGDDVVQQVQVTDRSGTVWLAYYAMQRQQDGSWRASGCRLTPPERSISV
jgi:hypothetical protein